MLFKNAVLEGIASGAITLAFRRWKRAPPVAGTTVKTQAGVLAIDAVDEVAERALTERDAQRAGFASRAELLASLPDEGQLLRMKVRLVGQDPRIALREQPLDDAALQKLPAGARELLQLIADHEGVVSHALSPRLGLDNAVFKRKVRQLKERGLTESLEVGYRLSTRGHDALRRLSRSRG